MPTPFIAFLNNPITKTLAEHGLTYAWEKYKSKNDYRKSTGKFQDKAWWLHNHGWQYSANRRFKMAYNRYNRPFRRAYRSFGRYARPYRRSYRSYGNRWGSAYRRYNSRRNFRRW